MKKNKNINKKINIYLTLTALALCVIVILVIAFNVFSIMFGKGAGSGDTVDLDSNSSMKNDQYIIGNNPTDYSIEVFDELTKSLETNDQLEISANVVKAFVADYFTWTNKDGTYEVGGLQYLYGPQFVMYDVRSRWTFYSDLDVYIEKYGRDKLLEVDSINITTKEDGGYFKIGYTEYKAYYIVAEWTYKDAAFDTSEFQKTGYFTVIDNNGRLEIVQFYDNYD
ncbi:MAG: hypothetical protein ACK5KQ_05910 [Anaerorhabdus sp.]